MTMLGLKTLPVNHPLRRIYQAVAGVLGLLLVVFGVLGLILSGDILRIPASTPFSVLCLAAGAILIGAALAGGDAAAVTNAWLGALLVVVGMVGLLTMHSDGANFLDVSMADVTILFLAGMVLLAAGFYGRTTPVVPDAGH
jgi:drug/metabolite transporter (DMT)-like permease